MQSEEFKNNLLGSDFSKIVGQDKVKKQIKSALLAGRHIILVGPPGVGKTTIAKSISELLPEMELTDDAFRQTPSGGATKVFSGTDRFVRVQGSPDLTAEDLIGDIDPIKALEFGPLSLEAFTPGKIFKANNGILFFDEVNRCSDKLQNAMLQVLQEGIATVGSYDVDFPANFIFIGTMNPDDNSTEELSAVFLDRFDLIYVSYPESHEDELNIVKQNSHVEANIPNSIFEYVVRFIRGMRHDKNLERHPSVRATIGLVERASSNAKVHGRGETTLKDVADVVSSVLSHRISLKPSVRYLKSVQQFVDEEFAQFVEDNKLDLGESG